MWQCDVMVSLVKPVHVAVQCDGVSGIACSCGSAM